MTPCDHCPIGPSCIAIKTGHHPYCTWAASGDPARVAEVHRLSGEPPPERQYPSVGQQIANAFGAAGRVVSDIAKGNRVLVSQEEKDRRQAICEEPCAEYDVSQNRCKKCGCSIAVKPWGASEKCPIGKW